MTQPWLLQAWGWGVNQQMGALSVCLSNKTNSKTQQNASEATETPDEGGDSRSKVRGGTDFVGL